MFSPQEHRIKSVKINRRERKVEYVFDDNSEWCSGDISNYWTNNDWAKILKPGLRVTLWTIQLTRVIGLQVFLKAGWTDAWCVGNDFGEKK